MSNPGKVFFVLFCLFVYFIIIIIIIIFYLFPFFIMCFLLGYSSGYIPDVSNTYPERALAKSGFVYAL